MRALADLMDTDDHRGVVYFAVSGDAIKVGYTTDVAKRIADLRTGSAKNIEMLDYVRAGRDVEIEIHRLLSDHRLRGEWFKYDEAEELMDLISDFIDTFDDEDDRCLDGRDSHILTVEELLHLVANPYFWRQT